jgi:hypothetical protein
MIPDLPTTPIRLKIYSTTIPRIHDTTCDRNRGVAFQEFYGGIIKHHKYQQKYHQKIWWYQFDGSLMMEVTSKQKYHHKLPSNIRHLLWTITGW